MGKQLENAVFLALRRNFKEIFYFQKKGECDFVFRDKDKKMQVFQVCWKINDENQEREINEKLEELKRGLLNDHIQLKYRFEENLHDRRIETDTGWRITLGRGLDIFQKPDDRFTLGFMDQTKRKCKATSIVYTRARE